jgi:hypothetical protein
MSKLIRVSLVPVAALAAAVAVQPAVAGDQHLLTNVPDAGIPSYGRAGGPVGAERITYLYTRAPYKNIAIAMDKDVVARTNMPLEREQQTWSVTYDKAVAERTNMPTREVEVPLHSAASK